MKTGRILSVLHRKYDLKITYESREGNTDLRGVDGEGDDGSGSLIVDFHYIFNPEVTYYYVCLCVCAYACARA